MKLFLLIFLLTILGIKCDDDFQCPAPTGTPSGTKRLHRDLFCKYDSSVRPAKKKENATLVTFHLLPQYVEFDEQRNTLLFFTWLDVSWIDENLIWKPSDYDDIKEMHMKSHEIWTPSLTLFNHGDMSEPQMAFYDADCVVKSNGNMQCILPTKLMSHCPTDFEEWPYDKHNCSIHIGAWMFEYAEMRFKLDNNSIDMSSFRSNHQWNVHVSPKSRSRSYHLRDNGDEGEMSIIISVYLQRHASRLAIIYILPITVLMILTMIVLWLDSQSLERIIVACVNFICHILAISDLHYSFPTQGTVTTPKILLFYEASVGLAAFALIFTCLLRKLRNLNTAAPLWLASSTASVINNPVITYIGVIVNHKRDVSLLAEGNSSEENKVSKDRTWQELATILECISFLIVFFTYIIMIGIVSPPKEPKDHYLGYWF